MIQKFIVSHITNEEVTAYTRIHDDGEIEREDEIMDPSSSSTPGTVYISLSSSTSWCPAEPLGFLRSPS